MHLGKKLSRATSFVAPEIPVDAVELAEALGLVCINATDATALSFVQPLELPAAAVVTPLAQVLRQVQEVRNGR